METENTERAAQEGQPTVVADKGQRLRTLIRQNSEKVGNWAEDVVLPRNKRSLKNKPPAFETIALDVENQAAPRSHISYNQQVKEFPVFMVLISGLQAVLFYFGGDLAWLTLGYDPHRRHELWRYLTIMLVHNSAMHLWGNVIFQLILGVLLEIIHHWRRIAIIYLASVLGGTLFITIIDPTVYGVGASAGVYGLLFAHVATIILNWNEMDNKCCRVFWLLLYIVLDVGGSLYLKFGAKIDTNTSHAGHLGGAVTGFLTSVLVLKNFEKHPWEKRVQKICAALLIFLAVTIIFVNIVLTFSTDFYTKSVYDTDYEHSLVLYSYNIVEKSPPDSEMRKRCEMDVECKEGWDQYRNGSRRITISSG